MTTLPADHFMGPLPALEVLLAILDNDTAAAQQVVANHGHEPIIESLTVLAMSLAQSVYGSDLAGAVRLLAMDFDAAAPTQQGHAPNDRPDPNDEPPTAA